MKFIHHDHSGKMQEGVFYRLALGDYSSDRVGDDWYSIPGEHDFFVEVTDWQRKSYECQLGHEYGKLISGRFNLQSETDAPLFSADAGFHVVSDLANQGLKASRLNAFNSVSLLPEPGSVYQKTLWAIRADRFPIDRRVVIAGKAPVCPICQTPLLCSACGRIQPKCQGCQQGRVRYFSTQNDLREALGALKPNEVPAVLRDKPPVVDGSKWKGEDVVHLRSMVAVTRRFLARMEALEIGAAHCPPIKVWIDKCSPHQLELLEIAGQA